MSSLGKPWLSTYEKLGIEIPRLADFTFADYIEDHARTLPDAFARH